MSYRPQSNYDVDVRAGLVAGRAKVGIRGHDETVPNGGPFSISPTFGVGSYVIDQSAIAATPAVVGIASTDNTNDNAAGTGALTVLVTGLDASGDAQSETVTMTGTTAANTVNTYSAVSQILVLTTGGNNANTGTIHVGTGTFTAGVPAVRMGSMGIGANISAFGYYVVPNGKTLYMESMTITVDGTKDAEVYIATSSDGVLWKTAISMSVKNGSVFTVIKAAPGNAAGDHVRLSALGTAASTDVSFVIDCELVDD